MAPRPADEDLPMASERPKKQAKTAPQVEKQPEFDVNDENQPPPATAEASIDYIASEILESIADPEIKIHGLIEGLESKDWVKVCESLNDVRRFALYHSDLLLPILDRVMLVIVKSMKNPRSALCKTSIMASSDIFKAFSDKLLEPSTSDAFDQLLLQLLLKASQDKKFVCEEANNAMKTVVESLAPLPLLHKLKSYGSHSNPRVRAKAAISISRCIAKMDMKGMEEFGLVSLVQTVAELLNDRLPEAREAARAIVASLYQALTENEEEKREKWQSFCHSNLTAIHAQAMIKLVS